MKCNASIPPVGLWRVHDATCASLVGEGLEQPPAYSVTGMGRFQLTVHLRVQRDIWQVDQLENMSGALVAGVYCSLLHVHSCMYIFITVTMM